MLGELTLLWRIRVGLADRGAPENSIARLLILALEGASDRGPQPLMHRVGRFGFLPLPLAVAQLSTPQHRKGAQCSTPYAPRGVIAMDVSPPRSR